jgi:ABC-type antimicrobial peptide transport system permease subunit
VVVRTGGDPRAHIAAVRNAVHALDPRLPLFDVKTLDEHLGISVLPARIAMSMLGLFGVLALVLAAVGLSGVIAFVMAARTREIGIRMALGALPADVMRLVLADGVRISAIGLAVGIALALALTRLVRPLLYGISPADPIAFAGAIALLAAVMLFAAWIPARRASRLDPIIALRNE